MTGTCQMMFFKGFAVLQRHSILQNWFNGPSFDFQSIIGYFFPVFILKTENAPKMANSLKLGDISLMIISAIDL